jgi:hypothetical protein
MSITLTLLWFCRGSHSVGYLWPVTDVGWFHFAVWSHEGKLIILCVTEFSLCCLVSAVHKYSDLLWTEHLRNASGGEQQRLSFWQDRYVFSAVFSQKLEISTLNVTAKALHQSNCQYLHSLIQTIWCVFLSTWIIENHTVHFTVYHCLYLNS